MWSFNTFKDKRYWILLIPAILTWSCSLFLPLIIFLKKLMFRHFYHIISIALFWSTYHLWKYFGDKKKRNNTDDSCDL